MPKRTQAALLISFRMNCAMVANRQQEVYLIIFFLKIFHCESFLELQDRNSEENEERKADVNHFHRTNVFNVAEVKMEWSVVKHVGRGLNNKTRQSVCQNICYMNSIIQCISVSAPFVQWLFTEDFAAKCESNI